MMMTIIFFVVQFILTKVGKIYISTETTDCVFCLYGQRICNLLFLLIFGMRFPCETPCACLLNSTIFVHKQIEHFDFFNGVWYKRRKQIG